MSKRRINDAEKQKIGNFDVFYKKILEHANEGESEGENEAKSEKERSPANIEKKLVEAEEGSDDYGIPRK